MRTLSPLIAALALSGCFESREAPANKIPAASQRQEPVFPHLTRQAVGICHLVRSFDFWILVESVSVLPTRRVQLPEGEFWATPVHWRVVSQVLANPSTGSATALSFLPGQEFVALDNSEFTALGETRIVPLTLFAGALYSDLAHSFAVGSQVWPNTTVLSSDLKDVNAGTRLLLEAAAKPECARLPWVASSPSATTTTTVNRFDAGAYQ